MYVLPPRVERLAASRVGRRRDCVPVRDGWARFGLFPALRKMAMSLLFPDFSLSLFLSLGTTRHQEPVANLPSRVSTLLITVGFVLASAHTAK